MSDAAGLKIAAEITRLEEVNTDLLAALIEVDRFSLVIESAVRSADWFHRAEVSAALKSARAAIARARGAITAPDGEGR